MNTLEQPTFYCDECGKYQGAGHGHGKCMVCEKVYGRCEHSSRSSTTKTASKQPLLEECGHMILTPTPEHGGGLWCAEKYPCKNHGKWKEKKSEYKTTTATTKPLSEEWNLEDLCVSHGKVTHKINEKCDVCEKMYAEIPHVQRLISEAKKEAVEEVSKKVELRIEILGNTDTPFKKKAFLELDGLKKDLDQFLKAMSELSSSERK